MSKIAEKVDELLEWGGTKKNIVLLAVSAIFLVISVFDLAVLSFDTAWIAIILCGVPIVIEAVIGLATEFNIKTDVLVAIALIAAVCTGEIFAAGEIAFIMQLGELLEELTVSKARAGIEKLVNLTPKTARVIKKGKEINIPVENVQVGDIIRILPGESIPVDGVIISGQTSVNQAVMTGEFLPVDKNEGDNVSSGTVNLFGAFEMRAEKVGEDSSVQRMVRLVKSADAGKAKIVSMADKLATAIVIAALISSVLIWLVTGEIIRAVTILVAFCPCALVIATPAAIMAAIGNAAKHGFLVREGDALERLSKVSKVVFDKTGTLTYGTPEVTYVKSFNSEFTDDELYALAAGAEHLSEHPLGKAIVKGYKKHFDCELPLEESFVMIVGRGVSAILNGVYILAGNKELLTENNIDFDRDALLTAEELMQNGNTVIYVAADGCFVGCIALSDTVRRQSKNMISGLKRFGVSPVLLTGDNANSAKTIAKHLGIDECYSDCFPEDKLGYISECQSKTQSVCMLGDGINDAPALRKADVGIAMGEVGSDIAVEAADIALVEDDIKQLPHLFALSKRMMTTIKLNIVFSMGLNFLAIILAATGILNPVAGAFIHNAGSVAVIINSALLVYFEF